VILLFILSTEKDHAVQCTCFIVHKYFEISAYLSLLHTFTRCQLVQDNINTRRIFTLSDHQGCPGPEWKYETKKTPYWWRNNREGRIMLQGHHAPGPCSQNQAGFSTCPSASLLSWTSAPPSLSHSRTLFPERSHFHFYNIQKKTNKNRKEVAVPLQ